MGEKGAQWQVTLARLWCTSATSVPLFSHPERYLVHSFYAKKNLFRFLDPHYFWAEAPIFFLAISLKFLLKKIINRFGPPPEPNLLNSPNLKCDCSKCQCGEVGRSVNKEDEDFCLLRRHHQQLRHGKGGAWRRTVCIT